MNFPEWLIRLLVRLRLLPTADIDEAWANGGPVHMCPRCPQFKGAYVTTNFGFGKLRILRCAICFTQFACVVIEGIEPSNVVEKARGGERG